MNPTNDSRKLVKVYRYLNSEHALLALQTRRWKIGRLSELDDPFDCRPNVTGIPNKDLEIPFVNNAAEQMGVLCYSSVINDPVVWSHYADCHRGIALGFKQPLDEGLFEVTYPKENIRPRIAYREIIDAEAEAKTNPNKLLDLIVRGFTQKASSWAYEREYRHFIYLHGCEMEGMHYFRDMPCKRLGEIILGANCTVPEEDVVRIIKKNMTRKGCYSPDVQVTKASQDDDHYIIKT